MSPATLPVLSFAAATLSTLVLAGWLLVPDKARHESRLWFAGSAAYALAAIVLAFKDHVPPLALAAVTTALPLLSVLLITESLRRETGRKALSLAVLGMIPWPYFGSLLALRATSGPAAAQVTHLSVITAIELYALWLLVPLGRRQTSRGLLVCGLGLGSICLANLGRIGSWVAGRPLTPLDAGTSESAALVVVFSLAVAVMSFGYWGYLLEQSHRDRVTATEAAARAQEAQRLTETFNIRLQELVRQRDAMITTASRFSTLSSLTVLNAGIVHEVSQPLQGLLAYLQTLATRAWGAQSETLTPHLKKATSLASDAVQLLQALRGLAAASPAPLEDVPISALMEKVLPVIESESRQRGVEFNFRQDVAAGAGAVRAQPVMLERAILNLVTNALEAMAPTGSARQGSRLELVCEVQPENSPDERRLQITVCDNGIGIEQAGPLCTGQDPLTTKPGGMGVGLLWVQLLIEQWGGEFTLANRPPSQGRGAMAICRLPLSDAAPAKPA